MNSQKNKNIGRILILIFILFFIKYPDLAEADDKVLIEQENPRIAEIRTILENYYIEPERLKKIDWKLINQIEKKKRIEEIFKNLDHHSRYMEADIFEMKYGENNKNKKEYGIGVKLEQEKPDDLSVQSIVITEVFPGGPAEKAGLLPKDVLIKINDENIVDYRFPEISKKIKGEKGSALKITVLRKNKEITFELIRDIVKIDLVASLMFEDEQLKIGYLKIKDFDRGTADELWEKIFNLIKEDVDKFILDLRGNLGGFFDEAIAVTDIFLKLNNIKVEKQSKIITTVRDKNNNTVFMPYSIDHAFSISSLIIIILINDKSASASEIVASALQDHKKAVIVGLPTFGKASVQTIFSLKDGEAITITTGRYYRPNGQTLQGYGVIPDIIIPKKITEEKPIKKEKNFERTLESIGDEPVVPFSKIPKKYQDDFQLRRTLEIIRSFEIMKK